MAGRPLGALFRPDAEESVQRSFAHMMRRPRIRRAARAAAHALPVGMAVIERLPIDGRFDFRLADRSLSYTAGLYDGVGRALFWAVSMSRRQRRHSLRPWPV